MHAAFATINDPFLRSLDAQRSHALLALLDSWGWSTPACLATVDSWFSNFSAPDKELALQILSSLDFYSPQRFRGRLQQLCSNILQTLAKLSIDLSEVVLVVDSSITDSSTHHARELGRALQLPDSHVHNVNHLPPSVKRPRVAIHFNDTLGSGNQFVHRIAPNLARWADHIIIAAIAIAPEALDRLALLDFRPTILPDTASPVASTIFTEVQCKRLRTLGTLVYAKHPMGYGDCGLLVAYYFQCPNDTIPLIWANGKNNQVNGRAYHWNCFVPYEPKPLSAPKTAPAVPSEDSKQLAIGRVDSVDDVFLSVSGTVGGPWAIAVALGLHSHAPYSERGVAPPLLWRLATQDSRVKEFVHKALEFGSSLKVAHPSSFDRMRSARELAVEPMKIWPRTLERSSLADYDELVLTLYTAGCPSESVLQRADAHMLSESYESAVALLSAVRPPSPEAIDRLVAIWVKLKRPADAVAAAEAIDIARLSQTTLENSMRAMLELKMYERINDVLAHYQSRFRNPIAGAFLSAFLPLYIAATVP